MKSPSLYQQIVKETTKKAVDRAFIPKKNSTQALNFSAKSKNSQTNMKKK